MADTDVDTKAMGEVAVEHDNDTASPAPTDPEIPLNVGAEVGDAPSGAVEDFKETAVGDVGDGASQVKDAGGESHDQSAGTSEDPSAETSSDGVEVSISPQEVPTSGTGDGPSSAGPTVTSEEAKATVVDNGEAGDRKSISPTATMILTADGDAGNSGAAGATAATTTALNDEVADSGGDDLFDTTSFTSLTSPQLPLGWQRAWAEDGSLFFRNPATGETSDVPPSQTESRPEAKVEAVATSTSPTCASPSQEEFDADPDKWTLLESLSRAKFDLNAIDISRFQQRTKVTVEHPKQTIGISVKDSRNDTLLPGAVVTHIQPGSPVSKHVELGVGDIIVSLDDKSLIGLPFPTILKMLQRAGKKATTTFEFIPSQKVFAHTVTGGDDGNLGLILEGNYIQSVEPDSPAAKSGVPPAHYILSVQDLSVSSFTTEDLEATLSGMYGDFTILTMAKSVYEAQRLGRGVLQRTMTSALIRTSGSIASTLKKVVGK
eukprot:m.454236 g.454236  ORF g.454236 m.454236 type:complete len:490 (-) comp20632_c0_seq1:97-1566(-)